MSMNYTPSSQGPSGSQETEGTMFPANPIWERSAKKRRGFGGGRKTTADTTAATTGATSAAGLGASAMDSPMDRPMTSGASTSG